jgi:hypothetical protein
MNVRGFIFEIVWADENILEAKLHAATEAFSGTTRCYVGLDESVKLAERFANFPENRTDVRQYDIGGDKPGTLSAGASIRLQCADSTGHVNVTVVIWDRTHGPERESVSLVFRTVPGEIDRFVSELRSMGDRIGAVAHLKEAT